MTPEDGQVVRVGLQGGADLLAHGEPARERYRRDGSKAPSIDSEGQDREQTKCEKRDEPMTPARAFESSFVLLSSEPAVRPERREMAQP